MDMPMTIKLSCAGLMLLAGVVTDMRTRKVPNKFVVAFFALSILLVLMLDGPRALPDALLSFVTAFISILPLYFMRALGGGDVKIFASVAPLLNWKFILVMLFASLVWGSLLGVIQSILKGQGKVLLHNLLGIFLRNKPQAESLHKIPYTIALLFGYLTSFTVGGLL